MRPRQPRFSFRTISVAVPILLALAFSAAPASFAHHAKSPAPDESLAAASPASGAEITYRKIFKTSYPEFVEIKLQENGTGTCDIRQLDEEASPQPFEITAPLVQRIFALAAKLHNFQGVDLEVHRRLANLGEKTLVYEKGAEKHQTVFNYTLDDSAAQLVNIFEGLARQTLDISDLTRTMRYDRLGVNDVLQQIEKDYNNKLLPEPDRLLPVLDQLAGDEKIIDIARNRARVLAGRIRSGH